MGHRGAWGAGATAWGGGTSGMGRAMGRSMKRQVGEGGVYKGWNSQLAKWGGGGGGYHSNSSKGSWKF